MDNNKKISIVIPTRNRPTLVPRAVKSALSQTFKSTEVIVVVDGPDEATIDTLKQIKDDRLKIILLQENVGGSDARNAGVKESKGEWVAFLDDDDEWLPEKLEKQIEAANQINNIFPAISCYLIVRTPSGDFVWPRRGPNPDEPISEYLFMRKSFFQGETLFANITLLARKKLFEIVPFRSGLKRYQDTDWILRAVQVDGFCFEMVPEPLAIWYNEEQRKTVSSQSMWRYTMAWLRKNHKLFTRRAYAGFVATQLTSQASSQGEWKAFVPLIREMCCFGPPRFIDIMLFFIMWFIPKDLRRKVRGRFTKS